MAKNNVVTKEEANNIIELPVQGENTETLSAEAMLDDMLGSAQTKSKSKVPIIEDKGYTALVDKTIELKRVLDDAKSEYEITSLQVVDRARTDYEKNKGIISSYKVQGSKNSVMISFKNQFKEIPIDNKDSLKKLCGSDYKKYFNEVYQITLKDTSVDKIQEIMTMIGPAKFKDMFEIKKSFIKPVETMNVLQFELPPAVKPLVEQYKGSVKV